MSNIIGPIKIETWCAMRDIRNSLVWMRSINSSMGGRFDNAIRKEDKLYNYFLGVVNGKVD